MPSTVRSLQRCNNKSRRLVMEVSVLRIGHRFVRDDRILPM